jgi:peptidoglycan/LPS O-acetylase OafA/YrhL
MAGQSQGQQEPDAARLPMMDAWRLLAMMAIVWLHTTSNYPPNAANLGRFGVPFFTAAAMFLMLRSARRKPDQRFADFAARRARRLYVPFLGWDVIYFVASNAKRHWVSHQPVLRPQISMLCAGTSLQLWFLPFLLIAMLGLFPLCRWIAASPPRARPIVAAALTGAGLCLAFVRQPGPALGNDMTPTEYFLLMAWGTLPAVFWGLALSTLKMPAPSGRRVVAVFGLLVLVAATAAVLIGGRSVLLENLAGIGALAAALMPGDWNWLRWPAKWGRDAYGIYLAHVLFVEAIFAVVALRGLENSIPLKLAEFGLTFLLSCALVWTLNRWRGTRWLNG